MGLLEGKVALISGGARGQGRAHALTCAREGADVVLFDIATRMETVPYELATLDDLEQTVQEVEELDQRALAVVGDVREQEQIDGAVGRALAELGRIDILIANAGIWTGDDFWKQSRAQWDEIIGVCLTGVWQSAKAVAPHMIERQSGSIVVTSSTNGMEPNFQSSAYVAAKHGVLGLMKNLAFELAPFGVRCNAVSPGLIQTGMIDHQAAYDISAGHPEATQADLLESGYHYHALKETTLMSPQVIADAALFLNSDLAAKVTGVNVPVDAGHALIPSYNTNPVRPAQEVTET